jgi:hypothetical protein
MSGICWWFENKSTKRFFNNISPMDKLTSYLTPKTLINPEFNPKYL